MGPSALSVIVALPLLGAIFNGFFGRRGGHERAALVANAAVLGSFAASVQVFASLLKHESVHTDIYTWFSTTGAMGALDVTLGLTADHLSGMLLLVITGIGFLIHLYSAGYMEHDAASWRYFAYLNLFVSAMLLLVLGDNLVTLFVGWEGVGLCSYLLIGFWFTDAAKASAGKKAFIVNRIGDFGFLIGMFILFALFGTLNVAKLKTDAGRIAQRAGAEATADEGTATFTRFDSPVRNPASRAFAPRMQESRTGASRLTQTVYTYHWLIGLALLCLFVGACGKSAQIPLYVWLPDAMAGPTPVSALIHAATMVTAGVYMIGRMSFLYVHVPEFLAVVAIVGVLTALFAALMALQQFDIKKVLAYSTVSQLGYMFVGMGAGAFSAGIFHLFTHAFFKACLFLGSGAVIHGLHEEQDIRRMGGLKKYMPQTRWTFLIATITIAGILPFSGFWSKDEILTQALHSEALHYIWPQLGKVVWVIGTITAFCTSFYMFRLYFLTFEGEYRGKVHPHEAGWEMTVPLWILATGSVLAALISAPLAEVLSKDVVHGWFNFPEFVGDALSKAPAAEEGALWPFYLLALGIAAAGYAAARAWYGHGFGEQDPMMEVVPGFAKASEHKFWVDEFYDATIVKPLWNGAKVLYRSVDQFFIDKVFVNGAAWVTALLARFFSPFENGDLSRYAALTALAGVGLILWAVL
jgi:NADH-quinone oxidoreductase subunit L